MQRSQPVGGKTLERMVGGGGSPEAKSSLVTMLQQFSDTALGALEGKLNTKVIAGEASLGSYLVAVARIRYVLDRFCAEPSKFLIDIGESTSRNMRPRRQLTITPVQEELGGFSEGIIIKFPHLFGNRITGIPLIDIVSFNQPAGERRMINFGPANIKLGINDEYIEGGVETRFDVLDGKGSVLGEEESILKSTGFTLDKRAALHRSLVYLANSLSAVSPAQGPKSVAKQG